MIRAIFFDAGHTLTEPIGGSWFPGHRFFEIARSHGLEIADDAAFGEALAAGYAFLNANHWVHTLDEEEAQFDEYYRVILRALGLPAPPDLTAELAHAYVRQLNFRPYDDVRPVLDRLREMDLPLAVITDSWSSVEQKFSDLGLRDYFASFVISSQQGCVKPDSGMFAPALQTIGVPPGAASSGGSTSSSPTWTSPLGVPPVLPGDRLVSPGRSSTMPSRVWILALMVGAGLALSASAQQAAGTAGAVPGSVAEPEQAEQALRRLDKQEFDLERALESARLDLASAQRRFAVTQDRLDAEAEPDTALRDEAGARRVQLSSEQRVASLLEERIERVRQQKEAWVRLDQLPRRAVLPEVLAEWTLEVARALEGLDRELVLKRGRAEELLRVLERETRELPLSARLRTLWHQLRSVWSYQLTGSEEEPITPGKIVSALVIFLIGYLVAGFIARLLGARVFPRMRLEEGAAHAFQSLTFYLLLLIAFITSRSTTSSRWKASTDPCSR